MQLLISMVLHCLQFQPILSSYQFRNHPSHFEVVFQRRSFHKMQEQLH